MTILSTMNTTLESVTATSAGASAGSPDLTRHPPRSPRVQLGGYSILPRCLDKGRATLKGKNGEYHFACPLDQQFLTFVGLQPEALRAELQAGKSDGEILAWIESQAQHRPSESEKASWNAAQEKRGPADPDSTAYFADLKAKIAPARTDISSWFELLDVDDYVSFGGRA